jgi:hypothetical protein
VKSDITTELSELIGERLNYIGRAANMLDIGFGEDVEYTTIKGEKRTVSRLVLHVQSSWRIIKEDVIVLAFNDFFVPKDGVSYAVFEENSFGNSQFDEESEKLNEVIKSNLIKVTKICADELGDITIFMDNKYRLEVFVDVSGIEESWRFFEMDSEKSHFVVFEKEDA